MLFTFKHTPQDFFVEELLGFELSGKGDVFFVQFEKENKNTMDIIAHLCKSFPIERKDLGISGLKDKHAVTRQRICIYKSVLEKIGGDQTKGREEFLKHLGQVAKIITTTWHDTPLAVGRHKYNRFRIVLRFKDTPSSELETNIEEKIKKIQTTGFPNCFGQQRFGKGNRNFKRACEIFQMTKKAMKNAFEIRFKLQAFSSMYFNHYALSRRKKGQHLLEGDILTSTFHAWKAEVGSYENQEIHLFDYQQCKEHYPDKEFFAPNYYDKTIPYDPKKWTPTGLILGYNMLLCPNGSKAFFKDWELIKKSKVLDYMESIKKHQLWGIRRPLWIIPKNFSYTWSPSHTYHPLKKQNSPVLDPSVPQSGTAPLQGDPASPLGGGTPEQSEGGGSYIEVPYESREGGCELTLNFTLPTGAYATVLLSSIFQDIDYNTCKQNKLLIPNEIISIN
ncbi:MAG: hypothetical protein CR971_00280 [candidate division SR1 bacterium]|nr:MAG: hypothetical protein CR971_00280 [candidate division SR1 bacterium]